MCMVISRAHRRHTVKMRPAGGAAEDGALPACSRVGAEVAAFKRSRELVPRQEKAGHHALPSDPPLHHKTSPLILSRRDWSWPCTAGPSAINHAYAVSSSSSGPNVSEKGANLMPSLQKGNSNGGDTTDQHLQAAAAITAVGDRIACCPSTQLWLAWCTALPRLKMLTHCESFYQCDRSCATSFAP